MNPLFIHKIDGVRFNDAIAQLNQNLDPKAFCSFISYTADIDDAVARKEVAQALFSVFDLQREGEWVKKAANPQQVTGIIGAMFNAGFDPSWTDEHDRTVLHYAAQFPTPALAETSSRFAVDQGCAPLAQDKDGYTAASYVWQSGWMGCGAINDTLRRPLNASTHAFARALLKSGDHPDSIDLHTGDRPLHQIMRVIDGEPHMPLLRDNLSEILLEAGARPNLRDAQGRTVLHLASMGDDSERLCARLIAYGADPAAVDLEGRTPADLAALSWQQRYEQLERSDRAHKRAPAPELDEPIGGGEMDLLEGGEGLARQVEDTEDHLRLVHERRQKAGAAPCIEDEAGTKIGSLKPPMIEEGLAVPGPGRAPAGPGQGEFF